MLLRGGGPLPNQKTLKQRASLDRITAFFFLLWFQKPARAQTNSNCMQQKTTKKHKNDTKIVPKGNQPVRGGGVPPEKTFLCTSLPVSRKLLLACFADASHFIWAPLRDPLESLSASFPLWEALGTLKWRFLRGFRFDTTFQLEFCSEMEGFGRAKT
jgi:hypothetical protein